jgi:RimJ/RimL family protein N-acetyltransferase/uncharacterized glyoxalase superfamily protein PhnB
MKIEPVETDRLTLRPMSSDDAADLFLVRSDPETVRYWDGPPHTRPAETRHMIAETLRGNGAWWTFRERGKQRAIGFIGFHGNTDVAGIGYILHRDYWRRGYGTEALRAVVDYGFNRLGLDRAELWIDEDNVASRRLAEKVGFERRSQFRTKWPHKSESHVMVVYGLVARDWPALARVLPPRIAFDRLEPILSVPDVRETAEYYRDRLGFTIEFLYGDPPTHAGVARGEWSFPSARLQLSQSEPGEIVGGLSLFVFVGPQIEQLFEAYRAGGVEVVSDLERKPWGMREFTIRDCNGYRLRFATPG